MKDNDIRTSVGVWQARLGLSHWQVAVIYSDEPITAGDRRMFAKCERHEYFDRATIRFEKCVLDDNASGLPDSIERDHINSGVVDWEEYIEVTIVHELLHMSLRNLMEAGDLVGSELGSAQRDVWNAAWIRAEEELCERTAIALVEAWPMESG